MSEDGSRPRRGEARAQCRDGSTWWQCRATSTMCMAYWAARTIASTASNAGWNSRICRSRRDLRSAMKSAVVLLPGLNRDRDMIAALTKIVGNAAGHRLADGNGDPRCRSDRHSRRLFLWRLSALRRHCGAHAGHARRRANRPPGRAGDRRLQRLPDPGRSRAAAGRADAQCLAEIRLPRGQARGRQRQYRRSPAPIARARSSAARSPITTAIISPTPRRLRGWKAKAGWCSAMPRAPIPTARSTTSPASSTRSGNVLGLMPHPENLIEPAHGGTDGRALFESALGLAA